LAQTEAGRRLAEHGPNRLTPARPHSALMRFLVQFHNTLIYVLLGASVVTALLGHWVDTGVIVGVVVINALIGFLQEGKAERALEAIRTMLSLKATVYRDGQRLSIPSEDLVPGDVVFLHSGDKVPADIRLFRIKELRIDEAPLTGESVPVGKSLEPAKEQAVLGDRLCMAYSGTLVTSGQGSGVVIATGDATELGRISQLVAEVPKLATRLLRQMADFGRQLTVAIVLLALAIGTFGIVVRNYSFGEMFLAAVGLAVAAIPEGLPAILTITLAIGVQRMARRNAIIRRLPAVETLGSVTVICSDKTGTLTRNEMVVQTVVTADHLFEVTGSGYEPRGGLMLDGADVSPGRDPVLVELARAALLCNDADLRQVQETWQIQGDPTEGALIPFAMKAGLDPATEHAAYPRTDVIPFESQHRFMATLHHDHAGHGIVYVKGAPEQVLGMSDRQLSQGADRPLDLGYWRQRLDEIANQGQRLLAVAMKATDADHRALRFSDVDGGLILLGLFGITDPPRSEAISAVEQCRSAGIRVKMITGDHVVTARAIGARMGIGDGVTAIAGQELEALDDEALQAKAREVDVFARVSPEHKLRLVQALQSNGEVVAMTGDGVNDAPALKRADVGIAMGIKGTEVAKEAAEMVLADDNFASIAHAVEEGRTVYDNIKKAITFILPTNGGEAGMIIVAILSGIVLPITPVQILWINMITAVTLALALAFEPPEVEVMKRRPRHPDEPILSPFLIWRILFVSSILVAGTLGLFLWDRFHGASIEAARTVAVNTLVLFEVFYLLNTRYLYASVLTRDGLFGNSSVYLAIALVVAAQVGFTYMPFMQRLFDGESLPWVDWVRMVLVASSVFVLVEIEKFFLRRQNPSPQ
jgi:magnesium-transporting ATPase (P-type)